MKNLVTAVLVTSLSSLTVQGADRGQDFICVTTITSGVASPDGRRWIPADFPSGETYQLKWSDVDGDYRLFPPSRHRVIGALDNSRLCKSDSQDPERTLMVTCHDDHDIIFVQANVYKRRMVIYQLQGYVIGNQAGSVAIADCSVR